MFIFRILSLKLGHMMAIAAIGLALFLIISACWNYCATDDNETGQKEDPAPRQKVAASEVRPGLIFVEGYPTNQDTLRIIQEYDAMRGPQSHLTNFIPFRPADILHGPGTPNNAFLQQPMSNFPAQNIHIPDGSLIDLQTPTLGERPPPYVPPDSLQHVSLDDS